jgi:hypothetical protein
MTREEAIAKVRNLPSWNISGGNPVAFVESLMTLGLLKLEEPKTVEDDAAASLIGAFVELSGDYPL